MGKLVSAQFQQLLILSRDIKTLNIHAKETENLKLQSGQLRIRYSVPVIDNVILCENDSTENNYVPFPKMSCSVSLISFVST